jgi:hypothetical protein
MEYTSRNTQDNQLADSYDLNGKYRRLHKITDVNTRPGKNTGLGNKNCVNSVSWFLVRDLGSDLKYRGACV